MIISSIFKWTASLQRDQKKDLQGEVVEIVWWQFLVPKKNIERYVYESLFFSMSFCNIINTLSSFIIWVTMHKDEKDT